MTRKQIPQPLAISSSKNNEENNPGPLSSRSLKSPKSPRSPFRFSSKPTQPFGDQSPMQVAEHQLRREPNLPSSPIGNSFLALQQPGSSSKTDRQDREPLPTSPAKGGFFSNYKASKSSSRLQTAETIKRTSEEAMSRDVDAEPMNSKVSASETKGNDSDREKSLTRRPVPNPSKPDTSTSTTSETGGSSSVSTETTSTSPPNIKKGKPKPFNLLGRTKSIRNDADTPNETTPSALAEPERGNTTGGIKTAPLRPDHDRSFRDIMSSAGRNRSADRHPSRRDGSVGKEPKDQAKVPAIPREVGGQSFLNNLKSGSSKAVHISKGLFNKVGRSGSTTEKEPVVDDEHYVLKVINLPLVEQTRRTRISKKLEDSRDKTEFWMPAFPWRAIDYLNYRGTETEGLYRVPGSGPQIKRWQRKFDEELDMDLFKQEDLYDINIVGSMLKAWLRELPEELFPKSSQERVARECHGAEKVPQLLIDELSNLPPYNYYLLFAITCHLSLLLEHSDKNKMDFRNLCICFQPCMKIDAFSFKFLVVDWRHCWKGCKTEDYWIDQENRLLELPAPSSSGEGRNSTAVESHDERNVSSSDSSKPSSVSLDNPLAKGMKSKPLALPQSQSSGSFLTINDIPSSSFMDEDATPNRVAQLQALSPIPPLSPMKL